MGELRMSRKERRRLEVFSRVRDGELSLVKAAELVGLSYRQAKRVYRRYQEAGDAGLVHGLRGQASNRAIDPTHRERVLELCKAKYADYGPTLAAECLLEEEKVQVEAETLRLWLIQAGQRELRQGRAKHRRWRARKEHRGEMVQMDGSDHDWFEGRRPRAVLMVMIDDATNETYARFFEAETTGAAFEVFRGYVQTYGLPHSLYVDKDSIYKTTRKATVDEQLAEQAPLTQFGRAMDELGVTLILAHSPQAKGRVERRHGLFQDRLVKALRRQGIDDLAAANVFLEQEFLPQINQRYTLLPAQEADLHRSLAPDQDLALVLAFKEQRQVRKDWTITWRKRWFQLTDSDASLALAGQDVTVCEQLDGTIHLLYRGRRLAYRELPERPKPAPPPPKPASTPRPPAPDHPWRRRFLPAKLPKHPLPTDSATAGSRPQGSAAPGTTRHRARP